MSKGVLSDELSWAILSARMFHNKRILISIPNKQNLFSRLEETVACVKIMEPPTDILNELSVGWTFRSRLDRLIGGVLIIMPYVTGSIIGSTC